MSLTNQGTKMEKTVVAQAIDQVIDQADQAGELFAKSEIDATQALELFARSVGTEPTFDTWTAKRLSFVNAYVRTKPTAKGNSADQAFARFVRRLTEAFGITAPKATSEAAIAKREQRAKKDDELLAKHRQATPTLLKEQLKAAYQTLADQPTSAKLKAQTKELEKVLKIKTKDSDAQAREELKGLRDQLRDLAKDCADTDKLQQAIDILTD
jgi:hypothetical protein